mmetsp:Transcript_15592/g.21307  ORF Transcript_15592/g.21307 Transcript_15592/m.21307 type:complete len:318 (-) Transcript_15592:123-1076(-)|eukprot:CAMPEP_0185737626 /NCGR_PEP_ID=MMETSP1171-20130828/30845_1 /TAXON_ID=374046 /ORGANISM="Helicotheca tamensis, Strain CCMP826" /LENGTH=317 /DNA_ID=CAMNT_0028408585 /DNA_START=9 /DNA_END=962 /DNA_ORIENTATION=-
MKLLSSFQGAFNVLDLDDESLISCIRAMQKQECSDYKRSYYMKKARLLQNLRIQSRGSPLRRKNQVNEDFRCEIVDWLFSMVDYLELNNETVSIAMSYVDRFLTTESGTPALSNRRTFQQASIASFFIAIKLFEPSTVDAETMSVCVRGEYSAEEILSMESVVLEALQWRVNPPTPLAFVHHFLSLCPQNLIPESVVCAIFDAARFQTEVAVKDYSLIEINPSTIAIASILNAMEEMPEAFLTYEARHAFLQKIMDITSNHQPLKESLKAKEKLKRGLQRGFNFEVLLLKYSLNSLSFKSVTDVGVAKTNMPFACDA